MKINQIINMMDDATTEMLEAYYDDQGDTIPYYVGKIDGLMEILKLELKRRGINDAG